MIIDDMTSNIELDVEIKCFSSMNADNEDSLAFPFSFRKQIISNIGWVLHFCSVDCAAEDMFVYSNGLSYDSMR